MYHFISGYTSKMAGTEQGVTEPQATFSSCFAQPFLALHPMRYAKMLAEKIEEHNSDAWLLNTGWVGAGATTGGVSFPKSNYHLLVLLLTTNRSAALSSTPAQFWMLFTQVTITPTPTQP
jgi:ATP-dependent phosphoenolpyruvate carboxykinase